jgi:hypothetical protein
LTSLRAKNSQALPLVPERCATLDARKWLDGVGQIHSSA